MYICENEKVLARLEKILGGSYYAIALAILDTLQNKAPSDFTKELLTDSSSYLLILLLMKNGILKPCKSVAIDSEQLAQG